jgi:hypothetical protein
LDAETLAAFLGANGHQLDERQSLLSRGPTVNGSIRGHDIARMLRAARCGRLFFTRDLRAWALQGCCSGSSEKRADAGSWKRGRRKLEAGSWKQEAGSRKQEAEV